MTTSTLDEVAQATKRNILIVTSSVAYAVDAIEKDAAPTFQLGTVVRMGLADEDVKDPSVIALMRWEYRAWVIGHALADISESISTFLNQIVEENSTALGCKEKYEKFERLGLNLKLKALPSIALDEDFHNAIECVTLARNCLIHRHGIVGAQDCNVGNELVLTWRGIQISKVLESVLMELDHSHRGPATSQPGDIVKFEVTGIERRFSLGARLDLEPNDLCTLSWCIGGITDAIHQKAKDAIQGSGAAISQETPRK